MKKLFLTSSIGTRGVAESIRSKLGHTKPLRTAFITTPIEVEDMTEDEWYQTDRKALRDNGFDFFDYTITGKTEKQIRQELAAIECIYISGGNEFYLKQQSNKNNFGQYMKEFVESGKIYIGTSCGSIIATTDMTPTLSITDGDHLPEPLSDKTGFGIVDFIVMPHWGSKEFESRKMDQAQQSYTEKWKLIFLNNFEYVEVKDEWYRIIDVRSEI